VDHELASRLDAYAADGTALFWTPEIVGVRMLEAYEVLSRIPLNWRPAQPSTAWPAIRQEWADLLDPEAYENARAQERRDPPSAHEMSRMEEAIQWPMLHLKALPLHADALMVWAGCLATGQSMRKKLAARNALAKAMAAKMTTEENARRAVRRAEIAREVCVWANRKLADAQGEMDALNVTAEDRSARCAVIKGNAQIRFQRAVDEADAWATTIKPNQAVPGKVRENMTLTKYRKLACTVLSDTLNSAGIMLREATIAINIDANE
jgi:hypothetical protein